MAKNPWAIAAIAAGGVVFGWAEWQAWRASRQALPPGATDAGQIVAGEAVLVLGCPPPLAQRWRVRIAVRSTDPDHARFVFSGAAVRGRSSEAQMMAGYAVGSLGVPPHNVVVEDRSTTTIENIDNARQLLSDSPAIKIASSPFHARRARQNLWDQSPELAMRLVRTRDYIPFEWGPLHALLLAFKTVRDRRRARSTPQA